MSSKKTSTTLTSSAKPAGEARKAKRARKRAARRAKRAASPMVQTLRAKGPAIAGKVLDAAVGQIPVVGKFASTLGLANVNFETLFKKIQTLWGDMRAAREDAAAAGLLDAPRGAAPGSGDEVSDIRAEPVAYSTVVRSFVDERVEDFTDPIFGRGVRLTGTQNGIDIKNYLSSVGAFGTSGLMILPNPNAFVKYINAENFGGRVAQFAGLYARYLVLRLEAFYCPSVATDTVNMFALGISMDPTVSDPTSFSEVTQYKGAVAAPYRAPMRATLIKDPEMEPRYCQLTTATAADKQNTIQCSLFAAANAQTGADATMGTLIFAYDIALFDPVLDQGFSAAPSMKPFYEAIAVAMKQLPFQMDARVHWEASYDIVRRISDAHDDAAYLDWYLSLKMLPRKPSHSGAGGLPLIEDFEPPSLKKR